MNKFALLAIAAVAVTATVVFGISPAEAWPTWSGPGWNDSNGFGF